MMNDTEKHTPRLFDDVCQIIETTRSRLATTVNAEVCLLNWHIGKRIKEDVLYSRRAEYGKEIVKTLAGKLTERYGKGWSDQKLRHCIRAAYTFTLCSEGNTEHIEYLMLEESNIKVAQYYAQLPDKKILREKLHKAIAIARENQIKNEDTSSQLNG